MPSFINSTVPSKEPYTFEDLESVNYKAQKLPYNNINFPCIIQLLNQSANN